MGVLFSKYKFYKLKKRDNNEEQRNLLDISREIDILNQNNHEYNKFINDEILPVINEIKSRIYYLEINNSKSNRLICKILNVDDIDDIDNVDNVDNKNTEEYFLSFNE
jgi:hypothetical protein